MTADEILEAILYLRRKVYFSPRFMRRRLSYVKNARELIALSRKAARLIFGHAAQGPLKAEEVSSAVR
jgi:hypothetical protein